MAKAKKEDEIKSIQEMNEKLNKTYGKGAVMYGNAKDKIKEIISTGSIGFDRATNIGGIPIGKLIQIHGPESSGKSTISLHIIAEFQKAGKTCLYMDFEYSFDAGYARQIGVDLDKLIIAQPESMEDGYNMLYDYIMSGLIDLAVIDSHTSMVAKVRLDGDIGDAKMAPEARLNSEALRKIKPILEKKECTVIGISQLRDDIGGMGAGAKPTGGNAWKFYPDMLIKIYKVLDRVNETNKTTIEVIKNKIGNPFGKCEVPIEWGVGIAKTKELVEIACEDGILKRSGSWISYNGENVGQGAEKVAAILDDNEEFKQEILDQVRNGKKTIIENKIEENDNSGVSDIS